ncbi:glycolate oxidase iron-sulfur subunit [compost metagenome]
MLQPELSVRLRDDKLQKLDSTGAETIASANIGCISHLQDGTEKPVVHWIELVDRVLRDGRRTTDGRDGSG